MFGSHAVNNLPQRYPLARLTTCRKFYIWRKCRTARGTTLAVAGLPLQMNKQVETDLIEGAELQKRPDSKHKPILYTHMLCPYAQRSLLTLFYKVTTLSPRLLARDGPTSEPLGVTHGQAIHFSAAWTVVDAACPIPSCPN